LYKASPEVLNDGEGLKASVISIIEGAGMHLLSVSMHQFEPQGVSVVAAISESHLTIHTWPEDGTALIDLFTCGDSTDMMVSNGPVPRQRGLLTRGGDCLHTARWPVIPHFSTSSIPTSSQPRTASFAVDLAQPSATSHNLPHNFLTNSQPPVSVHNKIM
jgi:S-adenosylmethionine decarboxylase proenzyme